MAGGLTALASVVACVLVPASAAASTANFQVTLDNGTKALPYALPPSSVVTIKWRPGADSAQAWLTTATPAGLTQKLEPQTVAFGPKQTLPTVDVDDTTHSQIVDGFGGALTDSSAWLIWNSPKRDEIMKALYGSEGARLTFTRIPLGASDYEASPFQSYWDAPTTSSFSIEHDEQYIIPLLQQAQQLNPSMKIMAAS